MHCTGQSGLWAGEPCAPSAATLLCFISFDVLKTALPAAFLILLICLPVCPLYLKSQGLAIAYPFNIILGTLLVVRQPFLVVLISSEKQNLS